MWVEIVKKKPNFESSKFILNLLNYQTIFVCLLSLTKYTLVNHNNLEPNSKYKLHNVGV